MGINLASVDSDTQSIVDSIIDNGADDDGFLNYDVTLKASAVQTRIRMAWRGVPHTPSSNIEYRFDNGVTVDPVSGMLVIPPGVSRFSLARSTRPEDSDEFLLDPQLDLNGRGVSENVGVLDDGGDTDPLIASKPRPPIVTALDVGRGQTVEGQRFIAKVTVSRPGTVAVNLKVIVATGADFEKPTKWTFSNKNIKWSKDGKSIIIPPGVKTFKITIATIDDATPEPAERFLLTIGGQRKLLLIHATAEVIKLTGTRASFEGGSLIFQVNLKKSNFVSQIPIGVKYGNGDKTDIVKPKKWKLNSGVSIVSVPTGSYFVVPRGVTQFQITVPTIDDQTFEGVSSMTLILGKQKSTVLFLDNDSQVKSVVSVFAKVYEGFVARYIVKVAPTFASGRYVKLAIINGSAKSADVQDKKNWVVSNGVTLKANGLFFVPTGVDTFNVDIEIANDKVIKETTEMFRFFADNISVKTTILPALNAVKIRFIGRSSAIKEGQGDAVLSLSFPSATIWRALRISVNQKAKQKFDASIISLHEPYDPEDPKGVAKKSSRIVFIPPGVDNFAVLLELISDKRWSGTQSAEIRIGSYVFPIKFVDDEEVVSSIFRGLKQAEDYGMAYVVENRIAKAKNTASLILPGKSIGDEKVGNWQRHWQGVTFDPKETIFVALGKKKKMAATKYSGYFAKTLDAINRAISDFSLPAPVPLSSDPSLILMNMRKNFVSWNDKLTVAAETLASLANVIREYTIASNPNDIADWLWMTDRSTMSLSNNFKTLSDRISAFSKFVADEFSDMKIHYQAAVENRNVQYIFDVVSAVISGAAIFGSAGFFTSNFRAFNGQIKPNIENGNISRADLGKAVRTILKKGVNGPATFGSATLFISNAWASIMSGIKASKSSSQFNFNEVMDASYKENFDKIEKAIDSLGKEMFSGVEFIIRKGEVGDPVEVAHFKNWEERRSTTGLIVDGKTLYWWDEPYWSQFTKEYTQRRRAILIPPVTVSVLSPIALDLSGEGLQFSTFADGALFDCDDDGQRDRTAWVAGGTALLAYDRDGDGAIIRTEEISFTRYLEGAKTDLEGLAFFDTNHDRLLDAHDLCWHQFGVWRDENGDGFSQPGEFVALDQAGIASISLVSDHKASVQGDTLIYGRSHFTRTDGTIGAVGDVGFRYISAAA